VWKGEITPMTGKHHTEESKHKISTSVSKKFNSPEYKKLLSEAVLGDRNGMYGKHHSASTKLKLRKSALGRTLSEETKLKISNGGKHAWERRKRTNLQYLNNN
jgi:hypothetical protein